ncbi:endonuclease/exonuclease/phosphatase family protein [Pontibacter akesuensis]|uniref:Endonuclease/Exonuclease/phosphatase family protein n=1 Tax=Pontibacter akesuensis TaxID=388950 RepID=A0A1I7FM62_9BACT|nr:hypothetical protein [Pontibacter akesuensis]GHA61521.1 endonuclease [Pontibacter akesuensis]SFU37261.1 Endonuclease/Exonuclease/phosphatase family protein [Pontibacter akesuensis]
MGCSKLPSTSSKGKLNTIAFYNTENLFDTKNDPKTKDEAYLPDGARQWTQERYQAKLKKLATTIESIAGDEGPAIVGLGEVENEQVVRDLISTSPLKKYNYGIIHHDMPDEEGLDVALIYRPKAFKPTATESLKVDYKDRNFRSREILQVKGQLRGELVTIYVNHWPTPSRTRRGKEDDKYQRLAAATLRREIKKQQDIDPNAKIIVMGDFAAEPKSEVMQKVLKATGRPNPAYNEELFNTHYMSFVNGLGSYHSRGDFQMYDQIMVSKSLLNEQGGLQFVRGSAGIHDPVPTKYTLGKFRETPRSTYNGNLYLGGTSSHFPVYIQVRKERR